MKYPQSNRKTRYKCEKEQTSLDNTPFHFYKDKVHIVISPGLPVILSESLLYCWVALATNFTLICVLSTSTATGSEAESQKAVVAGSNVRLSTRGMSASTTVAKTVCLRGHSEWSARLIKKSGPSPTQPTMPLRMAGVYSLGIPLKETCCTSSVPCTTAYGGPVICMKKFFDSQRSVLLRL